MTLSPKDILRREARERRGRIRPAAGEGEAVAKSFIEILKPQPGQGIALYRAKGDEFDPSPLLKALRDMGCRCALPVMIPSSRVLRFALWHPGDPLEPAPFGIDQPPVTPDTVWIDPAIVAVPLLAFDSGGNRLGYGGGYYDCTLHALRGRHPVLAVGLAHPGQEFPAPLPVESHDIKLDWIITSSGAHAF